MTSDITEPRTHTLFTTIRTFMNGLSSWPRFLAWSWSGPPRVAGELEDSDPNGPTYLFVPGWGVSSGTGRRALEMLHARRPARRLLFAPFDPRPMEPDKKVGLLRELIEKEVPAESELVLVGHSYGGLVAARATMLLDSERRRRTRVVTVASPFHGARPSVLRLGRVRDLLRGVGWGDAELRYMDPKTGKLAELRASLADRDFQLLNFTPAGDQIVAPDAAAIEGCRRHLPTVYGHNTPMVAPEAVAAWVDEIDAPPPVGQ